MKVKTHLIIKEHWNEYNIKWLGNLKDANPILDKKGYLTFVIVSGNGRYELKTMDMIHLTEMAKRVTYPHGRAAVTEDKGYVYVKEKEGEKLIGIVSHKHIRKYAPMYDDI